MWIEIHHAEPFGQTDTFRHVADFKAGDDLDPLAALELAYRHSQNIEGSWSKGPWVHDARNFDYCPAIRVVAPLKAMNGIYYGHRSTSVGDRMKVGDVWYVVAGMGFKPL